MTFYARSDTRLPPQTLAVGIVIAALPETLRILPVLPWWIERTLLLVAGIWFVNLMNFMDGIDWMTVAEAIPLTAGLAIFGLLGALPYELRLSLFRSARDYRLCTLQSPSRALVSRRCGKFTDRLIAGLATRPARRQRTSYSSCAMPLYYIADDYHAAS